MNSRQLATALGLACAMTLGGGWALRAQETPVVQQADAGAYLAARAAMQAGDFENAAQFLTAAIRSDSGNALLIETAIAAEIGRGNFPRALPLAESLADMGIHSQLSAIVQMQAMVAAEDWEAVLALVDQGPAISPLADRMARGWAKAGLGDMQGAIAVFGELAQDRGLQSFGLYHKALALALVGDFESADAILSLPAGEGVRPSRRMVVAHVQILSQLDRNAEAMALIDRTFPLASDPDIADLRARLNAGEALPWTMVRNPAAGLAEAFYSLAGAILDETDDVTVLFQARMAQMLDPAHADATFLVAQLLERLAQDHLAAEAYGRVPKDHPSYPLAALGRADILAREGEPAAAIEVLGQLARDYPDLISAQLRLADALRNADRLREAAATYDRVIDSLPEGDAGAWRVFYARAITHFALDDWDAAEPDFQAAIALAPNQPGLLNYYGYSLVERGEKLEEALEMIRHAIALDPQNGAIVDSLGWALYRLGQLDEALPHLERAAELEPTDPVVNDHLGDIYWQVGRIREARFQWARALSFDPTEAEAEAIRRKLAEGLDRVDGPAARLDEERQNTGG